jgi:hypothetical protein
MATQRTVRQAVDRIVELGLAAPDAAAPHDLENYLDMPLVEYGGGDGEAAILTGLLVDLSVGFDVHTDDVEHLDGYTSALEELAACTGGLFTVTDIELDEDGDGQELLRFRRNGEPVQWYVDHVDDEYLDVMAFAENVDEFTSPASPKRWAMPIVDGDLIPARFIFGEPAALRSLGAEYGVDFDFYPE